MAAMLKMALKVDTLPPPPPTKSSAAGKKKNKNPCPSLNKITLLHIKGLDFQDTLCLSVVLFAILVSYANLILWQPPTCHNHFILLNFVVVEETSGNQCRPGETTQPTQSQSQTGKDLSAMLIVKTSKIHSLKQHVMQVEGKDRAEVL